MEEDKEERQLPCAMKEMFDPIDEIQERSKFLNQGLDSLEKGIFQTKRNVQAIKEEFGIMNLL